MSFHHIFSIPPLHFNEHHVFKGQVLTVPKKQCSIFMGPSGIGKSTLFRAIQTHALKSGLKVIMMTQKDQLLPWSNTLDNVVFGAKVRGDSVPYDKARHMLKQVGLHGFENHYPHELSSGMRKRVALARTFMENADLILLDEPFETVDVETRKTLYALTKKLLKGKTLLMISHDFTDVSYLADHVFVLTGRPAVVEKMDGERQRSKKLNRN